MEPKPIVPKRTQMPLIRAWILIGILSFCISIGIGSWIISSPKTFLFFPGDPAMADFLIIPASLMLLVTLLVWLAARRVPEKSYKGAVRLVFSAALLNFLIPASSIGYRFSANWAGIRTTPASIRANLSEFASKRRILDPMIIALQPDWLEYKLQLEGFGEVIVKRPIPEKDYVRVDFGNGGNATFLLPFMYCTYSD